MIGGNDIPQVAHLLVGPAHDPAENPVAHGQVRARRRTRGRQLDTLREGLVKEMPRCFVGNVRVRQGEPEHERTFMVLANIRIGLVGKQSRAVMAMLEPGGRVGRHPTSRRRHVVANGVGRGHQFFGLDPVHSLRRLRIRGVFLESVVRQLVLESVVLDLAPDIEEIVVLRFRETVVLSEQRELVPELLPPPGRMWHALGHGCPVHGAAGAVRIHRRPHCDSRRHAQRMGRGRILIPYAQLRQPFEPGSLDAVTAIQVRCGGLHLVHHDDDRVRTGRVSRRTRHQGFPRAGRRPPRIASLGAPAAPLFGSWGPPRRPSVRDGPALGFRTGRLPARPRSEGLTTAFRANRMLCRVHM